MTNRIGLTTLLNIQPGEGRLVGLLVSLYFVLITALVLVQTIAFGLFLAEYGPQGLPYAYMAVAVLASLVAFAYLKLSERIAFARLLRLNLGFLIVGCLALWLGLISPAGRWTIFLLPVWFQIFINLANLVVWPLAVRLFDVRQGKRLFGLVGAGNWLANILGGIVVAPLVAWLGPAQLLPVAALVVVGALGILGVIARAYLDPSVPAAPRQASPGQRQDVRPWLGRYVWLIVGYIALWWVAFFFVDNIFYAQAAGQYPDAAQLTAFIGRVLSVIGIIALVVTLFLTGRVLGRFGLWAGLLTMPSLVTILMATLALGGSLGASALFLFWLATLGKVMNVALGFSLSQSANGVMY